MSKDHDQVIDLIFGELRKAEEKFPGWPTDPVHGAAIVGEEAGELTQAALDFYYGRERYRDKMQKEAAQVGAMAIRFLIGIREVALLSKRRQVFEEERP